VLSYLFTTPEVGEKLDPDEVAEIIQACGNSQEGFIAYVRE